MHKLTHALPNAYFPDMKLHVICCVVALLLLTSCAAVYVGPRMGFDVPITQSNSSSTGVLGGAWAGMFVSDRLSIEIAPGVGSQELTRSESGAYINNGIEVYQTSYQSSSISYADLPLKVRYGFAPRSATFVPYASVGTTFQVLRSRRFLVNGSSIINRVEWPFYEENQQLQANDRRSFAISAAGGVEYALSKTWHVRGEASLITRLSTFNTGAGTVLIGYDAFDNQIYDNFSLSYPKTSLALHVGIVGYF